MYQLLRCGRWVLGSITAAYDEPLQEVPLLIKLSRTSLGGLPCSSVYLSLPYTEASLSYTWEVHEVCKPTLPSAQPSLDTESDWGILPRCPEDDHRSHVVKSVPL